MTTIKGGLISESLLLWLKLPQKGANNYVSWVLSTKREDAQDSDLTPFWGDLSQSEKLSEIKLPLFADIYSFTKRDLDKIEFCVAVLAEER